MKNEDFNKLIGIKESYQMPEKLMEILMGENVIDFYDEFLKLSPDLSRDCLRDYFQEEQGDRKKLKQDYTPDCVCDLIGKLSSESKCTLDACSGTGALTIASGTSGWHECEEISERALPVLILNLGIRGIRGAVSKKDVIKNETEKAFEMVPAGKYTRPVLLSEKPAPRKFDKIVSNPPYSLKYKDVDNASDDSRFCYGITPKGYSDFLFVQDALSRLSDDGELFEILPHGVLFRGNREGKIREKLIEANVIDAIIGLPDNLFLNTSIPVLLMILKKGERTSDVLFVDGSKLFKKDGSVNKMTAEHIDEITSAVKLRKSIDKLSYVATIEEIRENGYNLNIPRYVDTFEPEPIPDLIEELNSLVELEREIGEVERNFIEMAAQLVGKDEENQKILNKQNEIFRGYLDGKSEKSKVAGGSPIFESEKGTDLSGRRDTDRTIRNERESQLSFVSGRS